MFEIRNIAPYLFLRTKPWRLIKPYPANLEKMVSSSQYQQMADGI